MIVTEKEARETKWCPLVRNGDPSRAAVNSTSERKGARLTCIGSTCMGWRWNADPDFREIDGEANGFCGFAGKPALFL